MEIISTNKTISYHQPMITTSGCCISAGRRGESLRSYWKTSINLDLRTNKIDGPYASIENVFQTIDREVDF